MKLFTILLVAFSFTQCASMKLDKNPPFKVQSASYTHITGGLPGNSTLNLMIEFSTSEDITFENVYFQKRITKAVIEQKLDKKYIAARYKTSSGADSKDMTLHAQPEKEFGNTSKTKEKFPFELKENEAIISYKLKDTLYYYKVENIKKEKGVFMPSAKPQTTKKHL